ncbi:hypothetical protein MKX07_004458 [Trichoderma sp. CBMAI-0711]|nr:hypothetical protein MKX07_004458 [Trichoderma sp. CBMAI-0711]
MRRKEDEDQSEMESQKEERSRWVGNRDDHEAVSRRGPAVLVQPAELRSAVAYSALFLSLILVIQPASPRASEDSPGFGAAGTPPTSCRSAADPTTPQAQGGTTKAG